jgi:hypothetical protein
MTISFTLLFKSGEIQRIIPVTAEFRKLALKVGEIFRQEGKKVQAERKNGNGHEKAVATIDHSSLRQEDIPTQACILVEVDCQTVDEHQLAKRIMTFGRLPNNDIQISFQRVSRFHGIIRWNNGAWVIEDAKCLNGLNCQGQRIYQLALVDGDRIYIDPTIVFEYREKRVE